MSDAPSPLESHFWRSVETEATNDGGVVTLGSPATGPPPAQASGFLRKQDTKGFLKGWKLRYFYLIDNLLYYKKDAADSEPISFVQIAGSAITTDYAHGNEGLHFDIECPDRTYHLSASSESERDYWMRALTYSQIYFATSGRGPWPDDLKPTTTSRVFARDILNIRPFSPASASHVPSGSPAGRRGHSRSRSRGARREFETTAADLGPHNVLITTSQNRQHFVSFEAGDEVEATIHDLEALRARVSAAADPTAAGEATAATGSPLPSGVELLDDVNEIAEAVEALVGVAEAIAAPSSVDGDEATDDDLLCLNRFLSLRAEPDGGPLSTDDATPAAILDALPSLLRLKTDALALLKDVQVIRDATDYDAEVVPVTDQVERSVSAMARLCAWAVAAPVVLEAADDGDDMMGNVASTAAASAAGQRLTSLFAELDAAVQTLFTSKMIGGSNERTTVQKITNAVVEVLAIVCGDSA